VLFLAFCAAGSPAYLAAMSLFYVAFAGLVIACII